MSSYKSNPLYSAWVKQMASKFNVSEAEIENKYAQAMDEVSKAYPNYEQSYKEVVAQHTVYAEYDSNHIKELKTPEPMNLKDLIKEFITVNSIETKEFVECVAELFESEFKSEADDRYREEFEEDGREGLIDPENCEPERDESRD